MPNLHQNISELGQESGPSTSDISTSSHSQQPQNIQNNEDAAIFPSVQPPSTAHPEETTAQVAFVSDLMARSKVSSTPNNIEPQQSTSSPKGKNARKKKNKQLHLNTAIDSNHAPVNEDLNYRSYGSPNTSSVHDFFRNHVSPMYVHNSVRYLDNTQYGHYQYIQNVQAIEMQQRQHGMTIPMPKSPQSVNLHAASVPNTRLINFQPRPGSVSIPCSPLANAQLNIQYQNMFFQNIMQHPLLSQSYNGFNSQLPNSNVQGNNAKAKNSPKHKKNKKDTQNNDDKKFLKYMSLAEVEEGLKNNTLIEGTIRINPKQFQHAYISSEDRDEQDVFIDGLKNRNRALEGDIVVVQLIESDNEDNMDTVDNDNKEQPQTKQRRGQVVFIKDKIHTRTCIGNLKLMPDKNRQRALLIPRDHRIPRLNIPFTSWPDNFYQDAKSYENTLFLAKIIEWSDTRFAMGKIISNIGQSGNMMTESKAILAQNDLDVTPFGPEVRDLFPRLDYTIPEEEIAKREDCRKLCLFSIDPSNCRDIDDAVSCRLLENGNYEVGVHISDVSYYLQENTILDSKVAEKATTIYLVERAYHMLPDELCMLCSLFPGVDKLAFSVFWEITKDAEVLSHRFSKTVINSCSQLAYDHAQAIIEDRADAEALFPETYNGFQYSEIKKSIQTLAEMAAKFRKNRFDGGALRIDQVKVAFHLNPANGLPDTFRIYDIKESHQMIEEFMLLANMTVARKIYEDHPDLAFLRCHPPPSGFMLKRLIKSLEPMGIELNASSAGDLHRSLLPYVEGDNINKGRAMVLNMLCAKPMARARYFCANACEDEDFHHYALNVPLYTHFTSPIRRYADIMVHRLLSASLKCREVPQWPIDHVRAVAAQCNKQKYNSKKASEMSSELYMLKYIEMNSPVVTEAVVVDVREKYIDVIVTAMGLNRRIFLNTDFPGEFNCIKHDGSVKMTKMEIKWREEDGKPELKQMIEVFSIITVQLHKGDDMVKVETKLCRPDIP